MSIRERRFEGAGGISLHADILGDDGGDPVVFLHGGGQTRHSWRRAAAAIARSGRQAICLDLRGHGDSDRSTDGVYSVDLLVGDIYRVIDQLGRLPALVGASVGGTASLTAVGEAENSIATALVLVDVTPRLNLGGAAAIKGFMRAAPNGYATVEEAVDAVNRYLPDRQQKASAEGLLRNMRQRPDSGRFFWHWDPHFVAGELVQREVVEARTTLAARRLRIPTLLVRGARSEIIDAESVRHFLDLVPHAEVSSVDGAGHMVVGDMNDAFNSAVLSFLDGVIDSRQRDC